MCTGYILAIISEAVCNWPRAVLLPVFGCFLLLGPSAVIVSKTGCCCYRFFLGLCCAPIEKASRCPLDGGCDLLSAVLADSKFCIGFVYKLKVLKVYY